ncbi:histone deacetylase [Brucepastera parasyntrophica]|uniref:histone deacetylase family protein n=1 Tax=Brucepastera parasyntrophica TaxID=2880008 RepID=UPI00210C9DE8|nr:histone deacetylase [Brucepastera parasyntrophica]ULQ59714.1 histone deacetylase [Brucepastera parasyntrophica]
MILYAPSTSVQYRDYGIMLPIEASRAQRIINFLEEKPRTSGCPIYSFDEAVRLLQDSHISITRSDVARVHSPEYAEQLYREGPEGLSAALMKAYELIDESGNYNRFCPEKAVLPLSSLFEKILLQTEGTYLACRLALSGSGEMGYRGFCYYLGGGMHHAYYDGGTGFCPINDILIAACRIQEEDRAQLIWIIDVDAHKGDGTAELVAFRRTIDRQKNIFTLSVHMAEGWPLDHDTLARAQEGRAPLVPSDIDIPVAGGEEELYISRLADGLAGLEQLSGNIIPDLAIVVDGADPYIGDGLPSSALLGLTLEQCLQRDKLIFRYLQERNIPSAWLMAGGYGDKAWEPTARFLNSLI